MVERSNHDKTCFVLMPLAREFEEVYEFGIKPAVEDVGLKYMKADEIHATGNFTHQIFENIYSSDVLIVDVSKANPNLFYELGIAHTLVKDVILITQDLEYVPSDIRSCRVLLYEITPNGIRKFTDELKNALSMVISSEKPSSPVIDALPELETVPKAKFDSIKEELDRVKKDLSARQAELTSIKQDKKKDTSLLLLSDELKTYLKDLMEEFVQKLKREIAHKAKIEDLQEQLQSAQRENRRFKEMTLVNPHWKGRNFEVEPDLLFLLMPFHEPWSDALWKEIDRISQEHEFRCERADEKDGRVIMDDIWEGISKSRVVVADLTGKNANVTYEVGLSDVLGKDVILLSQTPDDVPFGFLGLRLITYNDSIDGVSKLSEELGKKLTSLKEQDNMTTEQTDAPEEE